MLVFAPFAVNIVVPDIFGQKKIGPEESKMYYQVPDFRILIVSHGVFKWFQEVFLEFEVREFLLLQKSHCKLTQRVQGKAGDMEVVVTAYLQSFIKEQNIRVSINGVPN